MNAPPGRIGTVTMTSPRSTRQSDAPIVGADNAIIATDSGQPFSPKTPDMFRSFAQVLHEKGVALDDIWKMAMRNPARLLGLEPAHAAVQPMDELFGVAQDPNDA